jgi:tungstate transport system substrate-binding protein
LLVVVAWRTPEGQAAIAGYKINGQQLFYPNANDPNA